MSEKKEIKEQSYFKGLTRMDYIQKAHEIIQEEGIKGISLRRLAKEMGCSTATLYRHFDSLEELIYYAELRTLESYILSLNRAEKHWKNIWDMYVGVWDCYAREAFAHAEAYDLLFFKYNNVMMKQSIREYYEMFPSDIQKTNQIFYQMLQTPDFMSRDFEMCKRCMDAKAISEENAVKLNRIVCMLFKGHFKTGLDEGIDPKEIPRRVKLFVDDVDTTVFALADDLQGYEGYLSYEK